MSRSTGHPDQFGRREPVNRQGQPSAETGARPQGQPQYGGQPQQSPQPLAQHSPQAPQRSQADLALNRLQEFGLVPADRAQPAPYRPPVDPSRGIPANFHAHWPQSNQQMAHQHTPQQQTVQQHPAAPASQQPSAYSYNPAVQQPHHLPSNPQAPGFAPGFPPDGYIAEPHPSVFSGQGQPAPLSHAPMHQSPAWPKNAPVQPGYPAQAAARQHQAYNPSTGMTPGADLYRQGFAAANPADFAGFEPQPPSHTVAGFRSAEPSLADWANPAPAAGQRTAVDNRWAAGQPVDDFHAAGPQPSAPHYAYETESGGALAAMPDDQYADEYYEEAPPRRSRWRTLALASAVIAVGGTGAVWAYAKFLGPAPSSDTPVIRSAQLPVKAKPLSPGGKQFDYSDSKVMGRLGDGSAAGADASDPNGTRKVQTLTVSRDGSIAPPPLPSPLPPGSETSADASNSAPVSVPGLTIVDGFGNPPGPQASPSPSSLNGAVVQKPLVRASVDDASVSDTPRPASPSRKLVVTPPAKVNSSPPAKPVLISGRDPVGSRDNDRVDAALAPARKTVEKPRKERLAALSEADTASASDDPVAASDGSAGYVAVLASVPRSDNSRMTALTQFANMQQQYGSVLQNKTPDVREANLGAKGAYHRLLVGPPGSREEASALCGELKSAGYKDCWVTAY